MSLTLDGLAALKQALLDLPAELQAEAGHVVEGYANRAAVDIKAAYAAHWITGELTKKLTVEFDLTSGVAASAVVKNTSKLAYIFENGTEARHYVTVNGKTHLTGRGPGFHVFIPVVERERAAMWVALADLVRSKGLQVTGNA